MKPDVEFVLNSDQAQIWIGIWWRGTILIAVFSSRNIKRKRVDRGSVHYTASLRR
jgi:hypothetical protein